MHSAVSAHNITNLSYFQPERRILKWLLHLSTSKWTQVSAFVVRGAIGVNFSELRELFMRSVDLRLIASENLDSFLLRACDGRLFPTRRSSAILVLHQDVASTDLSRWRFEVLCSWKLFDLFISEVFRAVPG